VKVKRVKRKTKRDIRTRNKTERRNSQSTTAEKGKERKEKKRTTGKPS